MTPEQAAENAAQILQQAAVVGTAPARVAALVQVADGWTRLHTALANAPKTIEPVEPELNAATPIEHYELGIDRIMRRNEELKRAMLAPTTIEPAPGEPAPLGYVLVQGGGDYWELCAHGPDPIDPDPERLRAVLHQGKLDGRSSYMLCKLVPIA